MKKAYVNIVRNFFEDRLSGKLFVVAGEYIGGSYGIVDFAGLPFASTSYAQALKYKKAIQDKMTTKGGWWKKEHFKIMKVSF